MHLQNLQPSLSRGRLHRDFAVEAPGANQGFVQNVHPDCKKRNVSLVWAISQWNVVNGKYLPVRRSYTHHPGIAAEAVQFLEIKKKVSVSYGHSAFSRMC